MGLGEFDRITLYRTIKSFIDNGVIPFLGEQNGDSLSDQNAKGLVFGDLVEKDVKIYQW